MSIPSLLQEALASKKINRIVNKLTKYDNLKYLDNITKIKSIAFITVDEDDDIYESFEKGFNLGKFCFENLAGDSPKIYESYYGTGEFYFVGTEEDIINKLKEIK